LEEDKNFGLKDLEDEIVSTNKHGESTIEKNT
jgi:hypothetical protein